MRVQLRVYDPLNLSGSHFTDQSIPLPQGLGWSGEQALPGVTDGVMTNLITPRVY